jgi:uncharacterized Rossmann fold enzyme
MCEIDRYNYLNASIWYKKILDFFGFDQNQDIKARDRLFTIRKQYNPISQLNKLQKKCLNRQLLFFGAGPSLYEILGNYSNFLQAKKDQFLFITADGAARGLIEHNMIPDVIVSDLDGLTFHLIEKFLSMGVLLVIHAHGDNLDKLQACEIILKKYENLIGTTQNDPIWPIINPGGFTDGDRALYFMHHIAPIDQPFYLIGYDFGEKIGRYSKPDYIEDLPMTPMKQKKTQIAQQLIQNLQENEKRFIQQYVFR